MNMEGYALALKHISSRNKSGIIKLVCDYIRDSLELDSVIQAKEDRYAELTTQINILKAKLINKVYPEEERSI